MLSSHSYNHRSGSALVFYSNMEGMEQCISLINYMSHEFRVWVPSILYVGLLIEALSWPTAVGPTDTRLVYLKIARRSRFQAP